MLFDNDRFERIKHTKIFKEKRHGAYKVTN